MKQETALIGLVLCCGIAAGLDNMFTKLYHFLNNTALKPVKLLATSTELRYNVSATRV